MAQKNLLKGFKRPKGLVFEEKDLESNYGKFIASPFESGYGTTIGNSLRRILLSSIQGYAVTAVRLTTYTDDGLSSVISNEFESIEGVVEDTPILIANLKGLKLSFPEEAGQVTINFQWKGEGVITGADLEKGGISVVNKDHVICTTMEDANFDMEIQFGVGRGYVPAEEHASFIDILGTLAVDSIFAPVTKVKLAVEKTRVGQRADYDKLILDIWTDGTISPEQALAEAAKIAKEHYTVFINFDESDVISDNREDEEAERIKTLLTTPVEVLELSVRSSNCLKIANIKTIGELTKMSEDEIAKTRNFGKKSLLEIKEKLKAWGLGFGMTDYSGLKNLEFPTRQNEEGQE